MRVKKLKMLGNLNLKSTAITTMMSHIMQVTTIRRYTITILLTKMSTS